MKARSCTASSASRVHVWLFPVFSQKGEALVFAGRGSIATSWPPVWSKVNIWREATVQAGTWGGALLVLPPTTLSANRPPPLPPCTAVGRTPPEARRDHSLPSQRQLHLLGSFFFPGRGPGCVLAGLKGSVGSQELQVYFIPTRMNTMKYIIRPLPAMRGIWFSFQGASLDFLIQVQVLFCVAREAKSAAGFAVKCQTMAAAAAAPFPPCSPAAVF